MNCSDLTYLKVIVNIVDSLCYGKRTKVLKAFSTMKSVYFHSGIPHSEFLLWHSELRTQHYLCGVQVRSPTQGSGLKDLALSLLWHGSQFWLPGQGELPYASGAAVKKKN